MRGRNTSEVRSLKILEGQFLCLENFSIFGQPHHVENFLKVAGQTGQPYCLAVFPAL